MTGGRESRVGTFEDLIAWQKARVLTARVYQVTGRGEFGRDFGLRDQIRRASVSVMSNIAEGQERGSPMEFYHFLNIAKGSCAELRSHLFVALDVGYLDSDTFTDMLGLATEVNRLIGGLRTAVGRNRETRNPS